MDRQLLTGHSVNGPQLHCSRMLEWFCQQQLGALEDQLAFDLFTIT